MRIRTARGDIIQNKDMIIKNFKVTASMQIIKGNHRMDYIIL